MDRQTQDGPCNELHGPIAALKYTIRLIVHRIGKLRNLSLFHHRGATMVVIPTIGG